MSPEEDAIDAEDTAGLLAAPDAFSAGEVLRHLAVPAADDGASLPSEGDGRGLGSLNHGAGCELRRSATETPVRAHREETT